MSSTDTGIFHVTVFDLKFYLIFFSFAQKKKRNFSLCPQKTKTTRSIDYHPRTQRQSQQNENYSSNLKRNDDM